jgi:hypothetical protein
MRERSLLIPTYYKSSNMDSDFLNLNINPLDSSFNPLPDRNFYI